MSDELEMLEEYEPVVVDLDGDQFEVIETIEFEDKVYAALTPYTEEDELEVPNVSMTFSRASVTNSLIEKMAEKCKIAQKTKNEIASDSLLERLELIRNWR